MDSQEKALFPQSALKEPAKKAYATKQEVLERVKEIAHSAEAPNKEDSTFSTNGNRFSWLWKR